MKKICFLNRECESEEHRKLKEKLKDSYEFTNFPSQADIIVQTVCAITDEEVAAMNFELERVSRLKKKGALFILTGCTVKIKGKEFFKKFDFVDYAITCDSLAQKVLNIIANYEKLSKNGRKN